MKKYIVIILLSFVCFYAKSQTQPSGFPTQFNTGWQQWGYQQSLNGTIIAKRDTLGWLPRFTGMTVVRPQDRDMYFYDSIILSWKKLWNSKDTLSSFMLSLGDSSNFVPTTEWVKQQTFASGGNITANNGLTKTGSNIQQGGALVQNTDIPNAGFDYFMHGVGQHVFRTTNGTFQSNIATSGIAASLTASGSGSNLFSEVNATEGVATINGGSNTSFYNTISVAQANIQLVTRANTSPHIFQFDLNGKLTIDSYVGSTYLTTDTSFNALVVDGSGNVWKRAGGGGGGGSGTVTSVSGTANRITVTSPTTTPVIDIATTYVGQPSIITLGTISTGVWNGTAIGATFGGTGQTTVTTGDLLYGSASNTWSKLADVATGNALISGGVATAPSWGKIGLTTHVSGILPIANGGTGTATPSLIAGTNISITGSWPNQTINSLSSSDTVFSTYVAYVDTLGNDGTGVVNNPAKPFATINGALTATATIWACTIAIGVGTFNSPDSALMRSNIWFRGSGMPVANDSVTVNAFYNNTIQAPTKLLGGTILRGTFAIPYNRENIHVTDFGVDVGSNWVTNFNSGVEVDGFLCAQLYNAAGGLPSADGKHQLQINTKPRRGMLFQNIRVLLASAVSPYHAFLIENTINPIADNIYTTFGFAGVVIKTIGGIYTNLHTRNHGTYHIILKSNDYSFCYGVVVDGFECATSGLGLTFDQGDPGSPGIYWCNVADGFINLTSGGMSLTGDNMNISNINVVGGGSVLAVGLIRSNVNNVINRISAGYGFDINPGSVLANGATTWNNCTAIGSALDGFFVHAGTARNDFESITSGENTGYGFNTNGAAWIGNHNYYTNTAGVSLGTLHNRVEITGLITAGSGISISGVGSEASPYSLSATAATTIYTGDGSIGSARTVTLGSNNLTFDASSSGDLKFTLGSDATGDLFYRSSGGSVTRRAIGSTGDVLTVSGGLPVWVAPDYAAGRYTPTLTNVSNVGASTAYECQYSRVGNVVTVSGKVDIDPTATGSFILAITVPLASALVTDNECGGTGVAGAVSDLYGGIRADPTNDRVELFGTIPVAGSIANQAWYFTFTYFIDIS